MAVHRISLGSLGVALNGCVKSYEDAIKTAMRKTAVFGQSAVIRTIKSTRSPEGFKIRASGTYESLANWVVTNTDNGASLTALAYHSYAVEAGRKPGTMPPKGPIWNWVQQKRIVPKTRAKDQSSRLVKIAKVVKAVRWKIHKRGIKGRWPLKRSMPRIAKYAKKEIKAQLRIAAGKPPKAKRSKTT